MVMLLCRVIAATEVEDLDGNVHSVDVTVRVPYVDDNGDPQDVTQVTRVVGRPEVGIIIEDGSGSPVLELHEGGST